MERDLVRRTQAGDHDAFAILAGDALERVYGTARLILLDQDRARDAARDALVTGWRDIRRLQDLNDFDPWLLGIVIHTCGRVAAVDASLAEPDDSRRAFSTLSRDDRTILALAYFAELSVPDASIALGVTEATAETALRAALDALRDALGLDTRAETRVDLEWRLRSWLAREAAPPDLTDVAETVAAAARAKRQRRRPLVGAGGRSSDRAGARRLTWRRLGVTLATGLALTVAIVGGVMLTRVVRPPEGAEPGQTALLGAFRPTGDISALAGSLDRPIIATLVDGRVLVVGLGDVLIGGIVYDPATDTYGDPIRDEVLRRGSAATTLKNSLVLLTGGMFGGSETAAPTAVLFDPVSTTFAATNPLAVPRVGHTATLLDDGRVLVAGGRHQSTRGTSQSSGRQVTEATAEIYDSATGAFTAAGTMLRPRADHTATKLGDGRVLIAGGYTQRDGGDPDAVAQAEIFDPATGTFRETGNMITARGGHSATLLADGRVLIVGGAGEFGPGGEPLDAIANGEIFDPKTGTFTAVASLVTERSGHSATLMADGRVLVAGGRNSVGDPRTTEIFDPAHGTFVAGPTARAPHHASLAPVIADGRILLAGSGPGGSELFDPHAAAPAAPSAAPGPRAFSPIQTGVMHDAPSLVELDDGRVLIVGGSIVGGQDMSDIAEIFDPTTGRVTPTGRRTAQLSESTTTRLPDGRILLVGNSPNGPAVAEIFDPADGTFEPAGETLSAPLRERRPFAVSGLPDGHLILTDGIDMIQSFDAVTGTVGQPVGVCEGPIAAIALDASRLLVGCYQGSEAAIVDLTAGTTESVGVLFDGAVRLDARRIALTSSTYDYVGSGRNPATLTNRVTAVYDQSEQVIRDVPQIVRIGTAVTIDGDRLLTFGGASAPSDEAIDLDTQTWTSTAIGTMLAARVRPAATVLRDGRVLIVGGARQSPDRTDPLPAGAEIFDPSLTH